MKGYDWKDVLKNKNMSIITTLIENKGFKVSNYDVDIHVNDVWDYENDWLAFVIFISKK